MSLIFKKDEIKTLQDLQEKSPDLYASLVAEAKSGSDEVIAGLKAQITKTENATKIGLFATKLGLTEKGNELIANETPYAEACEALLTSYEAPASPEAETEEIDEFMDSSASPAGVIAPDGDSDEPKTLHEAINMVAKRDGITKNAAKDVCKTEFPKLFSI